MGLFGPPNIEKMKAKKDVEGLIKALGFQHTFETRKSAAIALGEIGDVRAVEPLCTTLTMDTEGNEQDIVRRAAITALGKLRDNRAVEPLISTLENRIDENRKFAAEALGQIGDSRAVVPLISKLLNDVLVAHTAALALIKIGEPSVEPLITKLKISKQYDRKKVAEVLVKIYQSGGIDENYRHLILAQHSIITKEHLDNTTHTDKRYREKGKPSDCTHDDYKTSHRDSGIGIDFPV